MKRLPAVLAAVLALLAASAGTAAAHEEISPSSVPAGRPAFLTLTAANERQVAATSVTLAPPDGLTLGSVSREPPGWTVERAGGAVTWSGGPLAPGKFEQWGVELEEPDQPGPFTFRSTLRFADGRTDTHSVVLTVTQGATVTTEPPEATTTSTAAIASTTVPPTPADDRVQAAPAPGGGSEGRANLALGLAGAALALALVAALVATRTARRCRPASGASEVQEW